jgi:hypothetical protein
MRTAARTPMRGPTLLVVLATATIARPLAELEDAAVPGALLLATQTTKPKRHTLALRLTLPPQLLARD